MDMYMDDVLADRNFLLSLAHLQNTNPDLKKDDKTTRVDKPSTATDRMSSQKGVLEEKVDVVTKELVDATEAQTGYHT